MLNRSLQLLVAGIFVLASVTGQLNRRHRRVRAAERRASAPQRASMFDIEEEVCCCVVVATVIVTLFALPLVSKSDNQKCLTLCRSPRINS